VAVAGIHVVVARIKVDGAVAQARVERPPGCKLPRRLNVGVDVPDLVCFIATQRPLHTERGSLEVLITPAPLAQLVVGNAGDQRERPSGQFGTVGPAQVGTGIAASQINDTPTMLGIALSRSGNGKILNHVAL